MKLPPGFRFSGVACGIKPHRPDLALVVSDGDAACAGAFTVNRAKAAPVADAEARLPAEGLRAIVINSGNANALTGPAGRDAVATVLGATAAALGVAPHQVLSASTGVIGMLLPQHKIVAALPRCVAELSSEPDRAAEAIMTTDTTRKLASRTIAIGDREVTLAGFCKGSGMIAPQLATTIAVVVTDCAIDAEVLDDALEAATHATFDQLVVDGDMSTNDSVFVLANGRAGNARIAAHGPALDVFSAALRDLLDELARAVAADGEGATKRLEAIVSGAPTEACARDLARSICGSPLVKAAMFGQDPNWGRVLSTVGARAGSQHYELDPAVASVTIQGVSVYDGAPRPFDRAQLRGRLREPEVVIDVDVRSGDHRARAYGCDLSYDYVKLNADYTSLLVEAPGGGVAKDDRLGNYSPAFKRALLVEALAYISRFRGKRCVIAAAGTALGRDSLRRSLCDDTLLLHSVGLVPVLVHAASAERVAGFPSGDARAAEMVTGQLTTELVTQLNKRGGHAVGLSGKDAAMLRVSKGGTVEVNAGILEAMLSQGYIPVVAPVGLGADGESHDLDVDVVAAALARTLGADKLVVLSDAAGVIDHGDLVSELTAAELQARRDAGTLTPEMAARTPALLDALRERVAAVHLLDGRTPHNIIAELFTDTGVGTLVKP